MERNRAAGGSLPRQRLSGLRETLTKQLTKLRKLRKLRIARSSLTTTC